MSSDDVLAAHDALLELTGGFSTYQFRALMVASAVEYNFVVALYTGVLLMPRLRELWSFSSADEALVSTSFFAGCFVGQAVIGALSDRFGRRRTLFVAVPLGWLSSLGMFLSTSVAALASMRAIAGFLAGGCLITGYVTFFEVTVARRRVLGKTMMVLVGWSVSALFVTAVAYAFRDAAWQWLAVSAAVPAPIALCFFTSDSPQYLLAKGRRGQALAALEEIACINGAAVPPEELARLLPKVPSGAVGGGSGDGGSDSGVFTADAGSDAGPAGGGGQMVEMAGSGAPRGGAFCTSTGFGSSGCGGDIKSAGDEEAADAGEVALASLPSRCVRLRALAAGALVSLAWFGSNCAYYGIVLWPLDVASDVYGVTALATLLEVPTYAAMPWLPRLFGSATRVWLAFLVCSCAVWALLAVVGVHGVLGTGLLLVERFAGTGCSTIVFVAAAEAFPTELRSSGVGIAASLGRLGSVLAPLLVSLVQGVSARAWVLAAIGGCAAVCALALERNHGRRS